MTRLAVWTSLAVGGVIYAAGKLYLGYTVSVLDWLDGIYWSGAALLLHWLNNRNERVQ